MRANRCRELPGSRGCLGRLTGMQACLLLLAAALLPAQHELAATNPHTSPEDVQAGGRIFRSHCAECHGPKGGGGRGPDLRRGEYFHGSSDAALFRVILNGIPGTQMPGVYFEGPQVWQLVSFVRSLAREAVPVTVPGDAARGEKLYRSKGGCAKCHSVQGQGGSLGPDLTHIGSMRTPDHLRASLIDPEREVLPASWSVKAVDAKGTAYSGILLN
ncbi:MAG: c-type cytochrome, partial [Acidobacteria bacterium]|nr:c-type cytochrome [Acidobacteriota bacterium]